MSENGAKWARGLLRGFLVVLFIAANVCSLITSASSTIRGATDHHVPIEIAWSSVGFLEIVSVTGALCMVLAAGWPLRILSALGVLLVVVVTAVAGWSAYGWWGLLAPIAVQVTAHLIDFAFRDELRIGRPDRARSVGHRLADRARPHRDPARSLLGWPVALLGRWRREPVQGSGSNPESEAGSFRDTGAEQMTASALETARRLYDETEGDWRTKGLAVVAEVELSERELMRATGLSKWKAHEIKVAHREGAPALKAVAG